MQDNVNKKFPAPIALFATLLYVALASALLPISLAGNTEVTQGYLFGSATVALTVIGLLLCSLHARQIKPVIPFGIITFIIFMVLGTPRLAAIIPLTFISVSLASYLCLTAKPYILILAGAVAYLPAFFVTGDALVSALAIIPFPAAYFLYHSYKAGMGRVDVVVRLSAVMGISLLAIILSDTYISLGTLDIEILKEHFDNFRITLTSEVANAIHLTYNQVLENSLSLEDATELSRAAISTIFNFLPAIFVITLFVVSYIIHSLYIAISIPVIDDTEAVKKAITFHMSVTSAVLFLVALIASATLRYDKNELGAVVAQNIYAIFIPGLTLIFFGFVGALARGAKSCLGILIYLALFGMLFYLPSVIFPVASIGGAAVIIITSAKSKLDNKKNGQDKP